VNSVPAKSTSRKERPLARRNRDAEVFQAAIEIFSEKGYSASSLQDVADRVGLLKGSLYHYISSKESLLYRIFHEAHIEARVLMTEVAALELPPREHLYQYLRRLTLWYLANRARSALYFTDWRYLTGEFGKIVRKDRREFEGYVRAIIQQALDDGDTRPDLDAKLASFAALSAVNSVLIWYSPGGQYNVERVASEIAELACASVFCTSRISVEVTAS
jgi:AcrR family transcriptional regulator